MKIKKMTLKKDDMEYCFCCGKVLKKEYHILSLGTAATEFEVCKSCLKNLNKKIEKALA